MTESTRGIMELVRVFISYSHDSIEHRQNVSDFAQQLRRAGIDAMVDHFVESEPPLSWPLWMNKQIDESEFVLVVVTEIYTRRFMHRETPGRGLGVRWEGAIITSELYHTSSDRVKFIPVVVDSADSMHIPSPLRLTIWYEIGTIGHRKLEPLLRHLLHQPAVVPEPVAPVMDLSSKQVSAESAGARESLRLRIEAAMTRARTGDRDSATAELEQLIDDAPKEIGALAAYNLGLLCQEEDAYSQINHGLPTCDRIAAGLAGSRSGEEQPPGRSPEYERALRSRGSSSCRPGMAATHSRGRNPAGLGKIGWQCTTCVSAGVDPC